MDDWLLALVGVVALAGLILHFRKILSGTGTTSAVFLTDRFFLFELRNEGTKGVTVKLEGGDRSGTGRPVVVSPVALEAGGASVVHLAFDHAPSPSPVEELVLTVTGQNGTRNLQLLWDDLAGGGAAKKLVSTPVYGVDILLADDSEGMNPQGQIRLEVEVCIAAQHDGMANGSDPDEWYRRVHKKLAYTSGNIFVP